MSLDQHLSTSNTFVNFEENSKYDTSAVSSPNDESGNASPTFHRYARFSFGNSLSDMKFAYEIIFSAPPTSPVVINTANNAPKLINQTVETVVPSQSFQWKYLGVICKGEFHPSSNVATFRVILPNSFVTTTYRIIDEHTMAVVVVEVDEKQQPTIQYGNMYRLN